MFIGRLNFIEMVLEKFNEIPINILTVFSPIEVDKTVSKIYLEAKNAKNS